MQHSNDKRGNGKEETLSILATSVHLQLNIKDGVFPSLYNSMEFAYLQSKPLANMLYFVMQLN